VVPVAALSGLKIAPNLKLPVDVAGEAIAILAKRGAGKTNTATVLVEELHAAGVQVVILDPVGAWWGIRSSKDGKSEGLPFARLGGVHGDVPLEQAAGALIADVAVDSGESLLIDLSDFPSKAAMARFVVDFGERLFRRKNRDKSLLHLVLEEADTFAPQSGKGDDARMRGAIEQIVRRGRSRGLGLTMITQRSAVLNKDVLSQADVLIAMRTTSPHDTAAIKLWVSAHGDDEHGVIASLPGLQDGEGWVWNPERGLLERVQFRLRTTFDSSETPKAGHTRAEPKKAAAIDLAKLGAEIEATAERAKEHDPRELRRQLKHERDVVTELRRQLEEQPPESQVVVEVPVPVLDAGLVERFERALGEAKELGERIKVAGGGLRELADEARVALGRASETTRGRSHLATSDETRAPTPPARAPRLAPTPQREQRRLESAPPARAAGDLNVSQPQQRILDALAALEAIGLVDAHKTQLALFAQASPKSSSYSNNLGHLNNQLGLIRYPSPGRVALTAEGRAIADASGAPTSTSELHDFVYSLVGGAKARLLEQLVAAYPAALNKQQLADAAGASPTSSSFSNNLGQLRSLGLIDYPQPGLIVALPVLFLEEAA
jgi:hypothetical protein